MDSHKNLLDSEFTRADEERLNIVSESQHKKAEQHNRSAVRTFTVVLVNDSGGKCDDQRKRNGITCLTATGNQNTKMTNTITMKPIIPPNNADRSILNHIGGPHSCTDQRGSGNSRRPGRRSNIPGPG